MADILKDELALPLYAAMTDNERHTELHLLQFDVAPNPIAMLDYMIGNRFRQQNIYGRVVAVAQATHGDVLPLGSGGANITIDFKHKVAAIAFLKFVDPAFAGPTLPLTNTTVDSLLDDIGAGAGNAQCMGGTDKTALLGLSQNRESRAMQLARDGLSGRIGLGRIAEARTN